MIAPLDVGARDIWLDDHEMPPGMAEVLEYLGTSYSQQTRIVLNDSWWSVYVPKQRGRQ
jgi:hypothetical protein